MITRFGYIVIITLLNFSCTTYNYVYTPNADGWKEADKAQMMSLQEYDVVHIKLKDGKSFNAKIVSLKDDLMIVESRHNELSVPYEQVARIKYDVNDSITLLKSSALAIAVPVILSTLFPLPLIFY